MIYLYRVVRLEHIKYHVVIAINKTFKLLKKLIYYLSANDETYMTNEAKKIH